MGMTFYYDSDCGFCRRAALRLREIAHRVDVAGTPLRHFAVFRAPGGDELGHRAVGAALVHGGGDRWTRLLGRVLLLRPLDRLWSGVYRLVATNRPLVSRIVGGWGT